MKRIILSLALTLGIAVACVLGGCAVGEAHVSYTLSEDGAHYIVQGVTGDKRGLTTLEVPSTYSAEEGGTALPVTEIADNAFYGCDELVQVTLPDGLKRIGQRAFAHCAFEKVTIPETVTKIGFAAFAACNLLTEIVIPSSVTVIEPRAFYCCPNLQKAYVKANVETLDFDVFYNLVTEHSGSVYTDTSLTEVWLSSSVKRIHRRALYGNMITDIYYQGSLEQWNSVYFYEYVEEEGKDDPVEKRYEKSEMIPAVNVHLNVAM